MLYIHTNVYFKKKKFIHNSTTKKSQLLISWCLLFQSLYMYPFYQVDLPQQGTIRERHYFHHLPRPAPGPNAFKCFLQFISSFFIFDNVSGILHTFSVLFVSPYWLWQKYNMYNRGNWLQIQVLPASSVCTIIASDNPILSHSVHDIPLVPGIGSEVA